MRDWDSKGQTPNDENDDDLNWDWLSDAEEKETGSSDRTGLTGKLDWQGDKPTSGGQSSDTGVTGNLDWQDDKPSSSGRSSDTGLTGNLDWQDDKPSGGRSSDTGLTGNLAWQDSTPFPDASNADIPTPPADDRWDAELTEDAEDSERDTLYRPPGSRGTTRPAPMDTSELLDWMSNPETDDDEPDSTPDWMLETDDAPSPAPNIVPVELPSWLDDLEPSEDFSQDVDESAQDDQEWSSELPPADSLEEAYEWADEGIGADAWSNEDAALSQLTDDDTSEDIPLPTDEELDFDAMFASGDNTPNAVAAFPTSDDSDDAFDFDAMLGLGHDDEEPLSGDPEFDSLFNAVNEDPDAAVEDPVFDQDEFDLDAILGQSEEEGDPVFDNLDMVALFTSDEDDELPDFSPPPAPKMPAPDLDLDAMFGSSNNADQDDWLAGFDAPADEPAEAEIDFDNFFAEADASETDNDYIANIVASSRTNEADEWFAEPVGADPDADPDWLDSLDDISLDDVMDTPPITPSRATPTSRQPEVDLDALFGDSDDSPVVSAPRGMIDTFDIDEFPELPDEEIPSFATQDNLDVPDWLREAAASTDDQLSAAGIIRQKYQDRPLESLDDRLRALREAGLSMSTAAAEAPERRRVLENVLPGVSDALAPGATIIGSAATLDAALRVTPDHQKNAALLSSLVGHSSAAEMNTSGASRKALPLGRWIAVAILLIAVLVPFFIPIGGIGDSPADAFVPGSPGSNAFVRIGTLSPGDFVLVAAEYGPTGAPELDPMLTVTLTHILSRGARPILVSTNPVGLRHAQNILMDLAGEANEKRAYYILGYQPGTLLGLRNLDANSNVVFASHGLAIDGLEDVSLMLIVAENADSVQTWVEQTRIGDQVPVVMASSAAAQPLIVPYTQQGQVAGLLTGYRDAVTYTRMLAAQGPVSIILPDRPTPVILPTALPVTPTEIPPTLMPVIATQEATAEVTVEATEALVAETVEVEFTATLAEPTATEISATATPDEPTPTNTRIPASTPQGTQATPTETPEPGLRITPPTSDSLVEVAIVIASNTVNTRSGPATTFDIVTVLAPGAQVRVLGYNDDESWVNIQIADGREAWIANSLVAIREVPASEAGPMTPQPPRGSQRPRGRRIAQIPTIDPALLLTQSALLTQMPGLELTSAAALTQMPNFQLTQDAVLTQIPSLDLTGAAALTQMPNFQLTQDAVLTQIPSLDLTGSAALTQFPALDLTGAAVFTQVPVLPFDDNSLTLTAPPLDNVNERWNATTFGLVAAIALIVIGNLVAGLRVLLRRNR